jgi:hypothetical protein
MHAQEPDNPQHSSSADDMGPHDVDILSTEHWSLLSTRSLIWNEMFTRASMFLTFVSASVVALALMAQATEFGDDFRLFALVLLPILLFVGLATYIRLVEALIFDFELEASMNRVRRGYLDAAPRLLKYFTTSGHDDEKGIMQSAGITSDSPLGLLWSTPFVVAVVDGMIAGVLAAIAAESLGGSRALYLGIGIAVGIVVVLILVLFARRQNLAFSSRFKPRFPTPDSDPADGSGS